MSLWRSSVALYIIPRCKWGGLGNEKRDLKVGIDSEMLAGQVVRQVRQVVRQVRQVGDDGPKNCIPRLLGAGLGKSRQVYASPTTGQKTCRQR